MSGGLAQLARAPALHAGGHRFDSDILHKGSKLTKISMFNNIKVEVNVGFKINCQRIVNSKKYNIEDSTLGAKLVY